jgi:hypothetical protein
VNEARLRTILLVASAYHLLLGAFMFFAPGGFYDSLAEYPPENHHFIKDLATFYIALGVVLYISVRRRTWRVPVLFFATLEYAIHAINHLVDVGEAASDGKGWFNFFAITLLTLILVALTTFAWRVHPEPDAEPERKRERDREGDERPAE